MSTTRLPELPEHAAAWVIPGDDGGSMKEWVDAKHERDGEFTAPLFTADQLHAYGLAVWKAAMEAAARVCQEYEAARWHAYKRGHGPERASDYCQGQSDGGGDCAEAIRGIPDPSALPLPELAGSPQERRE